MVKKNNQVDPSDLLPIDRLGYFLSESEKIAEQAKRGKRSLTGDNASAERFHECRTQATRAFREMQTIVSPVASPSLDRTLSDIDKELTHFFSPKTAPADRRDLRRQIELLLKTEVEPALQAPSRAGTEFIPIEIVDGSKRYAINVARQANRCFQCDCFDACAVMIRRLLETLIIEVFEKKGIANKIKDGSGNYLMFTDLVSRLINASETPVGRTTRKELPNVAIVLNNCAHSRTFNISKSQLVQYQTFIVIAVQELMSLWEIRKP